MQDIKKDSKFKYFAVSRLALINDLKIKIIEIEKIKLTNLKSSFLLDEKIRDLKEISRKMEPVVHETDEFEFTIPEFLDRVLGSLWATF